MINLLSDYYEDIPFPKEIFEITLYNLNWKIFPNFICFTKSKEKIINKSKINIKEELLNLINKFISKNNDYLFYIMSIDGIIISKKLIKCVNYLFLNLKTILKFSIINYETIKKKCFHFSLHLIREESKFFYNLENCEINLTKINNNILSCEDPNYSNNNIELDDEEQKNSEEREDELLVQGNFCEKVNIEIAEYLFAQKYDRPFKKFIFFKNHTQNESNIFLNKNNLYKIYLRDGIPYEKRPQRKIIKKVVIKNNDFSLRNLDILFHFKECIEMLIVYNNLQKFAFYCNNIPNSDNFKGWKYLSKLFYENYNIRWINLKNSCLTDKSFEIIISSLFDKRIRYLNLCSNQITDDIMKNLEIFLEKNVTLKRLYLGFNEITNFGLTYILEGIKNHPNLNLLHLSGCYLRNSGNSLKEILQCKTLYNLFIKDTHLNLNDFQILSNEMIKDDCVISYLDIGFNSLHDHQEYIEIGKIIKYNRSLRKLCLDGMRFNMKNYLPVFTSIYKNKNIECYSFNQNKDLRLEGVLNFFSKINYIRELSLIPWNPNVETMRHFSKEEIQLFKIFHKNNPHIKIHGIDFDKV